jgi:hypothetical protein
MQRTYAFNINLALNELLNAVIQNLVSAPSEPKAGQFYFDTTKKELGYYNGSEWKYASSATLAEATSSTLGGVKLKGDIEGGTGSEPHVTDLHLAAATSIGQRLTHLSNPTEAEDAANKQWVLEQIEAKLNGYSWKQPVFLATAAALPGYTHSGSEATGSLEATANGALEVDEVKATAGVRIAVLNATESKELGIYEVIKAGGASEKWKLTRTKDANTGAEIQDATFLVEEGVENEGKTFQVSTKPPITLDTTALAIVEIQNGATIQGDGTFTKREANQLKIIGAEALPGEPAEGDVEVISRGVGRIAKASLKGDGSKTEFEVEHKLNTEVLFVQALESLSKKPTVPIEFDWEVSGTEKLKFKFPTAPAAGKLYFFLILG